MKKGSYILTVLIAFLVLHQSSFAQDSTSTTSTSNKVRMAGVRISSKDAVINNSITYKHFLNPTLAIEGLFSFSDPAALGFLVEKHTPLGSTGLNWFWGAGAYVGFGGGRQFGAQGAVGLDFLFPALPLNFSLDWKPELNFTRQFSFEPAAVAFSARFAF